MRGAQRGARAWSGVSGRPQAIDAASAGGVAQRRRIASCS